jgi:hypothetical protein
MWLSQQSLELVPESVVKGASLNFYLFFSSTRQAKNFKKLFAHL